MATTKEARIAIKDQGQLMGESLSASMAEKFRSDRKSWVNFVRSGKRTLKIINGLLKSNSLELIPDDITNDQTDSYKSLLSETGNLLKRAHKEEPNALVIDNIISLIAPFAGIKEMKADIEHPDRVAKEYRGFIKKMRRSSARKEFSKEFDSVVYGKVAIGFVIAELSYVGISYADLMTDFTRFGAKFELGMGFSPIILGIAYFLSSSVRAASKPFLKEYRKSAKELLNGVMNKATLKDGVSDELIRDVDAKNSFIAERIKARLKIHDERKPESLGGQLFRNVYDSYSTNVEEAKSLIDDIWYFGNNKGKEYVELEAAKQVTYSLLRNIKAQEEKLSYRPFAQNDGDRDRRLQLEAEYSVTIGKLIDLLDQAVYLQVAGGKPTISIANAALDKIKRIPISRRKFLKGMGWAAATVMTTFLHTYFINVGILRKDDSLDLLRDGINNRKEVKMIEGIDKMEIRALSRTFKKTLIEIWPELPFRYPNMIEDLLNTDGYGNQLQVQAQIYFAANYEIDPEDKKANQKMYERFLTENYIPRMITYSKQLDLDPITMVSGVVLSASNITDVGRQNEDVSVSKNQMILGGLGLWLHTNWNIPLSEFTKMALYDVVGPYNAPRLTGQPTIGFNDIEIPLIANGFYQLPREVRMKYAKSHPEIIDALSVFDKNTETENARKKLLREQIEEYVELYANQNPERDDERSPVFELIRKNEGWDEIGMGENPSVGELAQQTTKFTRVWGQLYYNFERDMDPRIIHETSFREARDQIIAIANQEGIPEASRALIADQIENPEFRKWWIENEPNVPQIVKQIINTYEDLEFDGSLMRRDIARAYKVLTPLEYDYDFQLATGLATIKYLTQQKNKHQYLNSLAKSNPIWDMFLALSIREIAPRTLLTQETNYPTNSDFDMPYNFDDTLEIIQALSTNIAIDFNIPNAHNVLSQLGVILRHTRSNGYDVPYFFDGERDMWANNYVPLLRKLDLTKYSSLYRSLDALSTIINANIPFEQ